MEKLIGSFVLGFLFICLFWKPIFNICLSLFVLEKRTVNGKIVRFYKKVAYMSYPYQPMIVGDIFYSTEVLSILITEYYVSIKTDTGFNKIQITSERFNELRANYLNGEKIYHSPCKKFTNDKFYFEDLFSSNKKTAIA